MHNVRRVPVGTLSAEAIAAQREQEQHKLATYKELENAYFKHRNANNFSKEALESTTALLSVNPEYYSVWNYRREILLHMFDQAPKDEAQRVRAQLLAEDLTLTQQSMPAQVKWRKELGLVDMMLGMDPRNFMGWNYRRSVIAELAAAMLDTKESDVPPFPSSLSSHVLQGKEKEAHLALAKSELKYALNKIESNFSNFSAWHYRSKLLPRVWDAEEFSEAQRASERAQEFELLQQAMYTDPSDQSIWIYHRWLVAQDPSRSVLEKQIKDISELAEMEPDSKCASSSSITAVH
ncbi:protein geranylgeranyltransferase type II [Malassezia japonica]|uniref:Geranylgeranyl transferase type-2 subunit alpha n=1 Tax=Malassezia japonica TaxID=223818 RepID=A0AAF0F6W5_9BASI|nr:protein geranylgeranyltransferase type II [Malassezia japonica]WFD39412.1 protein geranylgeranyltransferase type II [Malassezia japonica]